jgi:hypothetical protein
VAIGGNVLRGWRTWISEVRFCMMAQMSLVSLGVKVVVASVPGAEGLLVSSMVVVLVMVMAFGFWLVCRSMAFGVVEQCCRCVKRKF